MQTLLQVFHVLLAAAMIALILVQRGAGASAGASFGAGASATVFGSRGAGSFLTHATAVTATGFFLVSFIMAVMAGRNVGPAEEEDLGVMGQLPAAEVVEDVPVAVPDPDVVPQSSTDVPQVPAAVDVPEVPQEVPVSTPAGDEPSAPAVQEGAAGGG